jgi:hypothetical protein
MNELQQALADIQAIRTQVARDTQFRGYGPVSVAISGLLAWLVAAVQSHVIKVNGDFSIFLCIWATTAAIAVGLTATETIHRARRMHKGCAGEMIFSAVLQLLPALLAGVLVTMVFLSAAPQALWMLPGLWEILFSLGVFASCRFLPREMVVAGIWYLAAGLTCLIVESGTRSLSPWSMGIPFGVGQLLVAFVLHYRSNNFVENR